MYQNQTYIFKYYYYKWDKLIIIKNDATSVWDSYFMDTFFSQRSHYIQISYGTSSEECIIRIGIIINILK